MVNATVAECSVLIRPKRSLLRTAVLTFWITSVPVFGVLYWFGALQGTWRTVIVIHVVVAVVSALLYWRQLTVYSGVTPRHIEGRGIFSPLESVPLTQVDSVVMVPVYGGSTADTALQLVTLDERGRCVYRMRGQFWHTDDLRRFAKALGRGLVEEPIAINEEEFFERYPGSEYWFENSALIRWVGIIVLTLVVGLAAIGLMALVGLPSAGS
ncbi:MAG: hypothetical protein QOI02_23 [Actinomycetota bacterium]|nr:hypothetical protein [Actinomycetota bacterium]